MRLPINRRELIIQNPGGVRDSVKFKMILVLKFALFSYNDVKISRCCTNITIGHLQRERESTMAASQGKAREP